MKLKTFLTRPFLWALIFIMPMTATALVESPALTVANELIPREVFFSNAERMRVRLSGDGQWYSFIAPTNNEDGTQGLGIFRAPVDNKDDIEPLLADGNSSFPEYFWTAVPNKLLFLRDIEGNENSQLYILDAESKAVTNITGDSTVQTRFLGESEKHPGMVFYSKNDRNPQYFDLYLLDVKTGVSQLVYKNQEGFLGFMTDDDLQARIAFKYDEEGNIDVYTRMSNEWNLLFEIPFEDVSGTNLVSADWATNTLYLVDTRGRDTAALKSMNLKTGEERILAESAKADIISVITNEEGTRPLAAEYNYKRKQFMPLTAKFAQELEQIQDLYPEADFQVMSQSEDDQLWLIAFFDDNSSIRYYLWDREAREGQLAYVMQEELDQLNLQPMHPVVIPSRDDLELVSYLTLPSGVEFDEKTQTASRAVPMVLYVHGGPWARDEWGYNPIHQWLANRGYAVLSVNFRGSTGFGKSFVTKSYGEWGAKMHDDLIDAVDWSVANGIADKDKVAIMGASYGGYATLVGLTSTPDVFAAGVDIVGPANLVTMQQSIPDYWKPFKNASVRRMGADVETEEGREFLRSRSPLFRADKIQRPLLIGHGDNDPRVKVAEAEQMTAKMQELKLPVTFVRFPDEGHGFARPENRQSFYAIVEVFLKQHLGGRAQSLDLVPGTTIHVPAGAKDIPGLQQELKDIK